MKKLLLLLAIIAGTYATHAQITLEHSYPTNARLTPFKVDSLIKYIGFDTTTNDANIYNDDHSLAVTVHLNIPRASKYTINSVYALSTKIFDNDNGYEFAVQYTDMSTSQIRYMIRIYDEDGTVLKEFINGWDFKLAIVNNSWKAVIDYYDFSKSGAQYSDVFSLPGTAPSNPPPASIVPNASTDINSSIYPNPMQSTAYITYQLPQDVSRGVINVYNAAGVQVHQYNVTNQFSDVQVDRNTLPSGIYFYEVAAPGVQAARQSFIIN